MKAPLSWLKDFIELDLPVDQLAEILTAAGLEVIRVEHVGSEWDPDKIFVGEVIEIKPHPNADRLNLAIINYGKEQPMTVVTGAPNLLPGDSGKKVALAIKGARLIDGYSQETRYINLKLTKIRGVYSEGMVLSEKELGISDDHQGILILDSDAPVGVSLKEYLGDAVLELDLTPNLSHALSIRGIARELAALTKKKLKEPSEKFSAGKFLVSSTHSTSSSPFIKVEIGEPNLCSRYSASLIKNVEVKSSPHWMRHRLRMAGMRPINNIVDITNYCMLEWGQPLHAFDYDKLMGKKIIIRRAHKEEEIVTLDGVLRNLSPDMLLITDGSGPVAIAGIMGGDKTEVSRETTNVFLESANFNSICIRRTAKILKLQSEASLRFGRGLDPELTVPTLRQASLLIRDLAKGELVKEIVDAYPTKVKEKAVLLDPLEVRRILGIELTSQEIKEILQSLQFRCEVGNSDGEVVIKVKVPTYRLDISIAADLIEEIARIYGYHRIPTTLLADSLPPQRSDSILKAEEQLRDILTDCGLNEVITYSLISLDGEARLHPKRELPDDHKYIKIINPITKDREYLRQSLLSGMLDTLKLNLKHTERIAIFEIGRGYLPRIDQELPQEPHLLAIALTGKMHPSSWKKEEIYEMDFFYLKGVLETLLKSLNIRDCIFESTSHPTFYPGRVATLTVKKVEIGVLGELSPEVRDNFDLPSRAIICLSEINLNKLFDLGEPGFFYRSVPKHPPIKQDMALVMDEEIPASRVLEVIKEAGGKLLSQITLFDLYQGEQIPPGKKSLTFSLIYQAEDRNLTDKEVQRVHKWIEKEVAQTLGVQLRS